MDCLDNRSEGITMETSSFPASGKPTAAGDIPAVLREYASIIVCPSCRNPLKAADQNISCQSCGAVYPIEGGIPLLYSPHNPDQDRDATQTVKAFYEENPFPNYDDMDSGKTLQEKARRGLFAKLLDEQLPPGSLLLEAGCGTGQLSNFLGMKRDRRVIGTDLCLNSLKLAKGFRDRCGIVNASFLQMNLFRPPFASEAFEVVISNGVLHHTNDPLGGFRSIARLVKPGGLIIIGLYNRIGRLTTDFRRLLFRITGDRLRFLDAHMRNRDFNERRKRAWFMDQYKHPCESKHSYDEVLWDWFDANNFDFLFSIPKIESTPFTSREQLFAPHDKGTKATRLMTQIEMLMNGGVDGALFIMIGRKRLEKVASDRNGPGQLGLSASV
jgi:SAM-dependent methyltransferase